ncbi:hypothetical protein, partial [Cyanobacterium aponinum]|uniref:hypothetical protein n=1 Tax=Cyanobacterium aponinum TaxID=379064 RepID=UPI000C13C364
LEAFSIILPEKFNVELTDVIHNIDRYKVLLPIIAYGFQWRSIDSFSEKTKELIDEGLSNANSCSGILDSLFAIAVIPNHSLNFEFINNLLEQQYLTTRDPFWCGSLHEDFEKQRGAWRLIEWSLKADLSSFSKESSYLWALFLSWCCAASDRRVRDRATKGLTRLFISHPSIIKITLIRFFDIDDDYILERVSLAAYSSILVVDDNDLVKDVANTIYAEIFDMGNISENALIRDWLRLIIELAYSRTLLNNNININKFRPPYNSQSIQIPSEEEIAHLIEQDAFTGNMNLTHFPGGFGGTDFAENILTPRILDHYDLESVGINLTEINRWFIKNVADLGYPGCQEKCYKYDRYLLGKYGGGRGRLTWVERLGKKYYWILLQRLAGILADHLPRKINSWEGDTSFPRLQGIDLRDIDPTDLRAFSPQREINIEWYQPINYDFNKVSDLSHEEWIALQDFPDLQKIIQITDSEGEQWLHLSLNSSLKKVISSEANAKYPYRNLENHIITVYVPDDEINNIKKELRRIQKGVSNTRLSLSFDIPRDNKLLLAEYSNTITCQQRFETGEIYLNYSIPGTENALITIFSKDCDFEYDCSQNKSNQNLILPLPDLVNFGNLTWDYQSIWLDESENVQIREIFKPSASGFLCKSNYMKNFLNEHSLALLFITYQQKVCITDVHDPSFKPNWQKTIYVFDGNKITKLYSS